MIVHPSSHENRDDHYSPQPIRDMAEIHADLDRLEADVAAAVRRIAAAQTPEPVDWEAVYRARFAELGALARRLTGGA